MSQGVSVGTEGEREMEGFAENDMLPRNHSTAGGERERKSKKNTGFTDLTS